MVNELRGVLPYVQLHFLSFDTIKGKSDVRKKTMQYNC